MLYLGVVIVFVTLEEIMKRFCLLMIFVLIHLSAWPGSLETTICLLNLTQQPHYITVKDVNNFDWDGRARPDHNLNGILLKANEEICQSEEVNYFAAITSLFFTISVNNSPAHMMFRLHSNPRGWSSNCRGSLALRRHCGDIAPNQDKWFEGDRCNIGSLCYLFYIE
jgi:hypothetical protein